MPFDGVLKIDSVLPDQRLIIVKMYDGTFESLKVVNQYEENSEKREFLGEGINLVEFYSLVSTFIRRGPFFVGDLDPRLGEVFSNSVIFDFENIADSVTLKQAFSGENMFSDHISGFELSQAGLHAFIGHFAIEDDEWIMFYGLKIKEGQVPVEYGLGKRIRIMDIEDVSYERKSYRDFFTKRYEYNFKAQLKNGHSELILNVMDDVRNPGSVAKAMKEGFNLLNKEV